VKIAFEMPLESRKIHRESLRELVKELEKRLALQEYLTILIEA
jgi:hypothetical protein